jgi:hypothetical protein
MPLSRPAWRLFRPGTEVAGHFKEIRQVLIQNAVRQSLELRGEHT